MSFGRYQIQAAIREGAIGATYLAVARGSQKTVVVRVLPSSYLRSPSKLAREAEELAERLRALRDPRIVPMHEVGVDEEAGGAYVVRDFVPGQTAAEAAAQHRLSLGDVVGIGISLGEALRTVHEAGIVHGDLKLSNLLLTPEGDIRLVDAGTAQLSADVRRVLARGNVTGPLVRVLGGKLLGLEPEKPSYAAPEVARGEAPKASADVYTAGRILHELAGEAAGPAQSSAVSRMALRSPFGRGAVRFQEVIHDLMAEDPRRRPSADGLIEELREVDGFLNAERSRTPPAARAVQPPNARFVNAWFEADEPVPPLIAETWYTLGIDIGARRGERAESERLIEPDFGGRDALDLLLSLYSDELDIKSHALELRLPRRGNSEERTTRVRGREPGLAKLEIVVSALPELEILQTLELAFRVQPALVTTA